MTLTFEVPLPPGELSPNKRGRQVHWADLAAAKRQYKEAVMLIAIGARNQACWRPAARVRVHLVFGTRRARSAPPDGLYRPLDVPNAVSAFKAGFDALVMARLFEDDNWRVMELGACRIDPSARDVVVTVEALE